MQPSPEIEAIIRDWFAAVANADPSWLDRHLSTDAKLRIIGTDPAEWLQGKQAQELLHADLAALGGNASFFVQQSEGYAEGDIGWGAAAFTITLPNELQISPRWSAVFHREDGQWKAVQIHASVGVTNEQLFGMPFDM